MTPEEETSLKENVATIKAVLVGVPDTDSRGIVGELSALKTDMAARFERVYKSLDAAGAKFVSNEAAGAAYVLKKECGNCSRLFLKIGDWRFWLLLVGLVALLLGVRIETVNSLAKTFSSLAKAFGL